MRQLLLSLLLLTACSRVNFYGDQRAQQVNFLAVLPQQNSKDIANLNTDQALIIKELRRNGFKVLEPWYVQKICQSDACKDRRAISELYGVSIFGNFKTTHGKEDLGFLGFSDYIAGELTLSDLNSEEFARIEYSEDLPQTSSIRQLAFAETKKQSPEEALRTTQTTVLRELIASIPQDNVGSNVDSMEYAQISDLNLKSQEDRLLVCARTLENLALFASLGQQKTELKEQSGGFYCGDLAADSNEKLVVVEALMPFGTVQRETIRVN